jgi:ABC-2 type transport system ATP-binding protein
MSIAVNGLVKNFGPQVAVNRISFSIAKGEVVGFLGPNGAGKSTTFKMITGYLCPDAGDISVCGKPVWPDTMAAKARIGYLPESNPLYTDMYVREYLRFAGNVHRVPGLTERIEQVIDLVGLRQEANKKIAQLSKGYKQRTGLAASLIHDPEVLILDEPTTGLDPNQIADIRTVIKDLGRQKTILFSSHIMQEVEAVCSRVIIINKGSIVADDELAKLQERGRGESGVLVEFSRQPDAALLPGLQHATGVEALSGTRFRIATGNAAALRQEILQMATQHSLDIVSLQNAGQNLEGIFRQLTGQS